MQRPPIYYGGISYHIDHSDARVEMCCLRIIAWIYGFILFFLFSLGIFPDISRMYVLFFAFQVPYVMFLITLAQRQRLRHAVLVFILTALVLIVNGSINFVPIIWLVDQPIFSGFYKNFPQSNHAAFVWTVILTLVLFFLNVATLYISFKSWRLFRGTLPLSLDPLSGDYAVMRADQLAQNHYESSGSGGEYQTPIVPTHCTDSNAQRVEQYQEFACQNCGSHTRRRINENENSTSDMSKIKLQFHQYCWMFVYYDDYDNEDSNANG